MTKTQFLTIGELAKRFRRPEWKIRRVVDSLNCDVPRIGLYRVIPVDLLPAIIERLRERTAAAKEAAILVESLRGQGLDIWTADKLEGVQQR